MRLLPFVFVVLAGSVAAYLKPEKVYVLKHGHDLGCYPHGQPADMTMIQVSPRDYDGGSDALVDAMVKFANTRTTGLTKDFVTTNTGDIRIVWRITVYNLGNRKPLTHRKLAKRMEGLTRLMWDLCADKQGHTRGAWLMVKTRHRRYKNTMVDSYKLEVDPENYWK